MIVSPSLRSCAGERSACDASPRSGSGEGDGGRWRAAHPARGRTPARRHAATSEGTGGRIANATATHDAIMRWDTAVRRERIKGGRAGPARDEVGAKMPAACTSSTRQAHSWEASPPANANRRGRPAGPAARRTWRRATRPRRILPTSTPPARRTWSTSRRKDVTRRVARAGGRIADAARHAGADPRGHGGQGRRAGRRAHRGDRGGEAHRGPDPARATRCRSPASP